MRVTEAGPVAVEVTRLDPQAVLPRYAQPGDAGADLVSTVEVELAPGERTLVPTGVAVAIPVGYVGLVHPRSGLALRCGVSLVNTPGTIDSGYRGEIKLIVINLDPRESVTLKAGERVAQLVIQPVIQADFVEVTQLSETTRGAEGFGSTGGADALGVIDLRERTSNENTSRT